jgi:hypothetical protein
MSASYALNATSASYANNATTASYANNSTSASYSNNSTSASYALTASFSLNVPVTSSYANNANSASYADTASFVTTAQTASFVQTAQTASFVQTAQTASFVQNAQTASYVLNAVSSSFATSASNALTASYLSGYVSPFPFTGSAIISGSLGVTGSLQVTNLSGSGVRYLVADESGSVTAQSASAALKSTQAFVSTAGQTTFSVTNGYSTGYVDVFINGSKLATAEFTDTSGTNIVLATGSFINDTVEVVKYTPALGVTNNVLRQLTTFTASAAQTVFSASYTPGLLDIFYNGSRLSPADFTANNGTFFTLATGSAANDILDVLVYSYQVGAFSGIGGVGTAAQVAYFDTTNSITGSPNFTISGSTMLITGSLTISGSSTFTNIGPAVFSGSLTSTAGFTGSFSGTATSASYSANADLLDGLDSTVFTLTSSFAAQTASFTAFTASQNILNGTYATTGSNTFAGIQTINSNLVVTGSITAQTLVVQTITSSVDFVTGSTRFGSLLANTHVFSGSVTMNPNGLFVSGSGLVGIGNVVPAYTLDVSGTGRFTNFLKVSGNNALGASSIGGMEMAYFGAEAKSRIIIGDGTGYSLSFSKRTGSANTDLFTITDAGDVTMSATSGVRILSVQTGGVEGRITATSGAWYIGSQSSVPLVLVAAGTGYMSIATNGVSTFTSTTTNLDNITIKNGSNKTNVTIGSAGGTAAFGGMQMYDNSSQVAVYLITDSTANSYVYSGFSIGASLASYKLQISTDSAGKPNGGSWANSSDIRLKENIKTIDNALDKITQLRGVTFDWKDETEQDNIKSSGGFIADEVMLTFPNWVKEVNSSDKQKEIVNDDKIKSLSLPFEFDALLVEAIKEANAKITSLEEKLQRNNIN